MDRFTREGTGAGRGIPPERGVSGALALREKAARGPPFRACETANGQLFGGASEMFSTARPTLPS